METIMIGLILLAMGFVAGAWAYRVRLNNWRRNASCSDLVAHARDFLEDIEPETDEEKYMLVRAKGYLCALQASFCKQEGEHA